MCYGMRNKIFRTVASHVFRVTPLFLWDCSSVTHYQMFSENNWNNILFFSVN